MDPDAALLERLRSSGIRIDGEGHFVHEGELVLHDGLRRALFRWLDRLPDGRYILRLDADRFAYLDVDDTPLVARALRFDGPDQVMLALSDGNQEVLDPDTLTIDAAGVIRCSVREGHLEARLSTSAAAILAERISQTATGAALDLGRHHYPLRPRPESPP